MLRDIYSNFDLSWSVSYGLLNLLQWCLLFLWFQLKRLLYDWYWFRFLFFLDSLNLRLNFHLLNRRYMLLLGYWLAWILLFPSLLPTLKLVFDSQDFLNGVVGSIDHHLT